MAAIISKFHVEDKTRTLQDLKCLRLITAIKTPYLPDGRLDLDAYDTLIDMQIASGVEGLVVGGITGEGHLLSSDELTLLISHTVNSFKNKAKVIGNIGFNSTNTAIRAAEQGFAVGMDASLHSSPRYGKTSLQGLASHLEMVLSIGPTIIHNAPSKTGHGIPPAMICSLAKHRNMVGVKTCCIGLNRIEDYVAHGLAIWSGNDRWCHDDRWVCGATGVISIASNLVPRLMHELMFKVGNHLLCSKLLPLFEWLFSEPNPIGINTALAQLGVVRPIFRLPYVPLPMEKRVSFVRIVEAIGREHFIGEKDVQVLEEEQFILLPH